MNYEELGRRLREAVIGMSDEDFFDSLARAGIELEDAEPQFFALDNHSWILISSDCAVAQKYGLRWKEL